MEQLFLESYEKDLKSGDIFLSESIENWPLEIQQIFEERFPILDSLPFELSFEKTDPNKFNAVGRIHVFIDDRKLTFPVIIRNRKLAPLDVFIIDGKFFPATLERLEAILRTGASFTKVQQPRATETSTPLVKTYFPPVALAGVAVSKAAERDTYTSLIDRIQYNLTDKDKNYLIEKLKNLPQTVSVKITEAHIERIVPGGNFYPDLNPAIDWDVVQVRRDQNDYFLYIGSSKLLAPFKIKLSPTTLKRLLSAENYNKFFENPALYLNLKTPQYLKGTIKIIPATRKTDFVLIDFPATVVATDSVANIRGWTFPLAADFNENCNRMLFLSADGKYAIDIKIPAVPVGKNNFNLANEYNLIPGDLFVLINPETKISIGPFNVLKKTVRDGSLIIDTPSKSIEITTNWFGTDNIKPRFIALSDENSVIVSRYILRKLKRNIELSTVSPEIQFMKAAVKKVDNKYAIDGIDFSPKSDINYKLLSKFAEKASFDLHNLSEADLAFILAHLGASSNDIERIKKVADNNPYCYFNYQGQLKKLDPSAKYRQAFVLHKIARELRKKATNDLLKFASLTEDPETLDKLLALNVITPETMVEFVDSIDEFVKCLTRLVKLLVATRLGAQFDETALKKTIEGLDEIIKQLNILKVGFMHYKQ